MKEGLLDRIKERGYWRINFQPKVIPETRLPLPDCRAIVAENSVELRGWDYPHISKRRDNESGYAPAGEFSENWVDWQNHIEFWRMYRSSQFLHYLALREDWIELSHFSDKRELNERPRRPLSVVGTIYQITEIYEFLFRLFEKGLYKAGARLSIQLHNSQGRVLWINSFDRVPFSYPRETEAPVVEIASDLTPELLATRDMQLARNALRELFENFDWSPADELLQNDQLKLINRRF